MVEAESALERARRDQAKQRAPFEYHSAVAYLEKAREQAVDGQYEDAIRFAQASRVYAERAMARVSSRGTSMSPANPVGAKE